MKRKVLNNVFYIIIGVVLTISITVVASLLLTAEEVIYNPLDTTWDVNNVKDALNELYKDSGINFDLNNTTLEWNFAYNGTNGTDGEPKVFVVPFTGTYKLEVWGAQGGDALGKAGAYGGYSTATTSLIKGTNLYVVVGGKGMAANVNTTGLRITGGYNGGGYGYIKYNTYPAGGGGATHMALSSGVLSSLEDKTEDILLVAGGGAGAYNYGGGQWSGNVGGGHSGGYQTKPNAAGTQDTGYAFGQGGDGPETYSTNSNHAGGGGGYYGGLAFWDGDAGGGSGYVKESLNNKIMYCYGCDEYLEGSTYTISTIGSNELKDSLNCSDGYSSKPISKCAKSYHGYAKITFIRE